MAGMGSWLPMRARAEVTLAFAEAYRRASKKDKVIILTKVVDATGWSRDNARRQLTAKAADPRRDRSR